MAAPAQAHLDPDIRSIVKEARAQGARVRSGTGRGHAKLELPTGRLLPIPGTPGDVRSSRNFRAQVRREGLTIGVAQPSRTKATELPHPNAPTMPERETQRAGRGQRIAELYGYLVGLNRPFTAMDARQWSSDNFGGETIGKAAFMRLISGGMVEDTGFVKPSKDPKRRGFKEYRIKGSLHTSLEVRAGTVTDAIVRAVRSINTEHNRPTIIREIAARLRLPRRTVGPTVGQLVERGLLERKQQGNSFLYWAPGWIQEKTSTPTPRTIEKPPAQQRSAVQATDERGQQLAQVLKQAADGLLLVAASLERAATLVAAPGASMP